MVFISGGSWLEFCTAADTPRTPNKTLPFHRISIFQSWVCEQVPQIFDDFIHSFLRGVEWEGSCCASRRETTRVSLKVCPPTAKIRFGAECGTCTSSDCNTATTGTVWGELSIFCESFNLCERAGHRDKGREAIG